VGALWSHKRVGDAVAAFAAIAAEFPDYRLEIVGPGTDTARRAVMELAREVGVADRVTLHGRLSPEELASRFLRARLLLFTSYVESFGLPVLEAMACGVPVVARRIAALDELVDPAPAWVSIDARPEEIGRRALEVLRDEVLWERHARAGREVVAQYSWESTARRTADVLRLAVAHGRRNGA
jgi:glycosyltransferase involved in cell wall biosynthesis